MIREKERERWVGENLLEPVNKLCTADSISGKHVS